MLINDLALLLDLYGNSEGTKLLMWRVIFFWCLLRQRNRGLNYVLKSTTILTDGSFSDNFNFSMNKASRAYNFCFISKRHVVFRWQSVGQIKTRLNAQKYKKDWNKFIFLLFKCLKFLPSRFTVLVTHSITCIILPLSNIIICFKLSYPWKQTTE